MKGNRTSHKLSGGCQCGAVRYRIEGPLGKAGFCHCRMCQKAFGNFGAALVTAEASRVVWTRGRPAGFRSSPVVVRGFCAKCGTPLFMREDGDPMIEIAIGTLDDPTVIGSMTEQSGIESKLHWFDAVAALPALKTAETRKPEDLALLNTLQHPDHDTELWP